MNTKSAAEVTLEITRHIKASPDRVYRAWTDPAQLKQWFGPEKVETRDFVADVRVGGKYRWDMINDDGEEMAVFGEYRELEQGKKVVFTWQWDDDQAWERQVSVVTIELSTRDGGTDLLLRHEQLPSPESRDRHNEGWSSVLNQLEKFSTK